MDKNDFIKRAYEPYYEESLYALSISIPIYILIFIVLILLKQEVLLIIIFLPYIIFSELILIHRISVFSFIEKQKELTVTKELTVLDIRQEISWTGKWESPLRKIYSKEMKVDRYKIICVDSEGKKYILRSAMSGKRWQIFSDAMFIWEKRRKGVTATNRKCTRNYPVLNITYGKLSRVILYYNGKDDLSYMLNRTF